MNTIIWEKPDLSIAVTVLTSGTDIDQEIQRIQSFHPDWEFKLKANQEDLNIRFDFFFPAYQINDQLELFHNMDRAKEVWKNKIQMDVVPHVNRLTREKSIAESQNNAARVQEIDANIAQLQQAHLNPNIDTATSLIDLMSTYPSIINY